MTKCNSTQTFVYRRNMSIGEADAEADAAFLQECFVNTGDFDALLDVANPKCIVLGRTGVGKSALLEQLASRVEHAIVIDPDALSLNHISNSNILRFFEDLGVNLDIFYNLLWRHVLSVELIKTKYHIVSEAAKQSWLERLAGLFQRDPKKEKALRYIESWGDKFWIDTEVRIKEFTEKLEQTLKAAIEAKVPDIKLSSSAISALSSEVKAEVICNANKVVNEVQIKELSEVIALLADHVFDNDKQKFYVVIDRLDEGWVDDQLRYKLIRALIEAIKTFRRIRPIKIAIAYRTDLLDRVLENTKASGFQLEKYESLFLEVAWSEPQLKQLLDYRINYLLKDLYTKQDVGFSDIFPKSIDNVPSIEYVLKRTLLRPRDAIMFVNSCLSEAQEKTAITASIVKAAEKEYSIKRLRSLQDEWLVEYPCLQKYMSILYQGRSAFKVGDVSENAIDELASALVERERETGDIAIRAAHELFEKGVPRERLSQGVFYILYKVGVVGIKPDGPRSVHWIQNKEMQLSPVEIKPKSIAHVHKMLWRALAINPT